MYVCHGQDVEKPLVSFCAIAPVLREAADVIGGNFTIDTDRVKLVDVMVPHCVLEFAALCNTDI